MKAVVGLLARHIVSHQMLPAIRHLASCSSRIAHRPIDYLRQATPEFISPDLWPPNSPNLNTVDYKIWGCVQEHAYQKSIRDVDQLKQRLVEVWSGVQQTVLDAAIGEWRKRLRVCVRAKGHYFEHLL